MSTGNGPSRGSESNGGGGGAGNSTAAGGSGFMSRLWGNGGDPQAAGAPVGNGNGSGGNGGSGGVRRQRDRVSIAPGGTAPTPINSNNTNSNNSNNNNSNNSNNTTTTNNNNNSSGTLPTSTHGGRGIRQRPPSTYGGGATDLGSPSASGGVGIANAAPPPRRERPERDLSLSLNNDRMPDSSLAQANKERDIARRHQFRQEQLRALREREESEGDFSLSKDRVASIVRVAESSVNVVVIPGYGNDDDYVLDYVSDSSADENDDAFGGYEEYSSSGREKVKQ
ncbi:hypothetical protein HK100_007673, partial [Physocladia obscura]